MGTTVVSASNNNASSKQVQSDDVMRIPVDHELSQFERDVLTRLHDVLLKLSIDDHDTPGFISVLISCGLEESNTPEFSNDSSNNLSIEFDSLDDMEDLLSRVRLSASVQEKNNGYLLGAQHIEQEVLPVNFAKHLLLKSMGSTISEFIHSILIWIGRRHEEKDRLVSLIFDLVQLHHKGQTPSEIFLEDMVNAYSLVDFFYRLAVAESMLRWKKREESSTLFSFRRLPPSHFLVKSLAKMKDELNMISDVTDGYVSKTIFQAWSNKYCPNIMDSFHQFVKLVIFPSTYDETAPSLLHFDIKTLNSSFFIDSSCPNLFALSISSPFVPLFQGFHRLYSSDDDGRSWPKIEYSILGYGGPTLFLIRATRPAALLHDKAREYTFGAYASTPWKKMKTPEFFGDHRCFLFQLTPSFKLIRSQVRKEQSGSIITSKFQYLFSSSGTGRSQTKGPSGIGFGGSATQPRLFLSDSLEYVSFHSFDMTFEPYELMPPLQGVTKLEVDCVEIWGVGNDLALKSMENHRDIKASTIRKARTVDKAAFLGDFRSGLIESKMFDYAQQIRDRDGGCLFDCEN